MKKSKIYVSGPISGHDIEERRKAFKEIQEHLEAQGYEVFNNNLDSGICLLLTFAPIFLKMFSLNECNLAVRRIVVE